jgi:dCTP deaminase
MFLTKKAIERAVNFEEIHLRQHNSTLSQDFKIGPNSVDVTLAPKLIVYDEPVLDMRNKPKTREIIIPEEGLLLTPGVLYIGATNETATSHRFVPMFEGRSSIGRLGIHTHITAGFGDIGWGYEITTTWDKHKNTFLRHEQRQNGPVVEVERYYFEPLYPTWTLEIAVVQPVIVYPNVRIGQVYFVEPSGQITHYEGKYSTQRDPQPSLLHKDF